MYPSHLEPLGIPEKVKYLTNGLSEIDAVCHRNSQACFLRRSETKNWAEKGTVHAEMPKTRVSECGVPYFATVITLGSNIAPQCSTHIHIEWWSRQVLDRRIAKVIRFVLETH
jgi:hypothetical protein